MTTPVFVPFPMPNDVIGTRTVVASVEYFDDERGAIALVLLLEQQPPFFTVAHYALTDVEGDGSPSRVGEIYVIGHHMNIVDAIREYEQSGGDR